jgi:hypothetical protein
MAASKRSAVSPIVSKLDHAVVAVDLVAGDAARVGSTGPRVASDEALEQALSAVRTLLRTSRTVEVAALGIDMLFEAGVVARCRVCRVSWPVSRAHFRHLAWWSCPSGCRRATTAVVEPVAR